MKMIKIEIKVFKNDVVACSSMLQPDMLPPVRACCTRTCFCLFKHVVAGHVVACSSMLQPDILPPAKACCIRTWCRLFKLVAAEHVAACSRMLHPDVFPPIQECCSRTCYRLFKHVAADVWLPPVRACCNLTRTIYSRDWIFSNLFRPWNDMSRCSSGAWRQKLHKCTHLYKILSAVGDSL